MAKLNNKTGEGGLVYSTNASLMAELLAPLQVKTLPKEQQRLHVYKDVHARRGKIVTVIGGFEGAPEELKMLGKELKDKCGVGGSVKDGLILIQGDWVQKCADLLREMGYSNIKWNK